MRPSWRSIAVAFFLVTLLAGGLFGNRLLALNNEAREVLRVYTELLSVAHDNYGEEVTYRNLVNASIQGMVRRLDPHTSFLTSEDYEMMRDRQQSTFYGLGILVGMRNGRLTVITPIEGTPGSRMGLRAGDMIGAIEGDSTEGMNINDAVGRLKGPKGTEVTITIIRPGLEEPFELTIVRDEIPQNTVRYAYMITPETGFIYISDFNRATGQEVRDAVTQLRGEGMKQLIIDLRNNGGGLLDQAIAVAEQFVGEGAKIVETRGRTRDATQVYYARDRGEGSAEIPLVVLVNEGTASAAEIFAGAVQDHDIGLIVGVPTWGKGLVQTVYSLSYGAGLALTTAKYYTPSGRLIQRDYSSWFDYATHSNGTLVDESGAAGEAGSVQAFSTDLGRTVYGGGGITPDVRFEPREIEPFLQFLLARSMFFDFAVEWVQENEIGDRSWNPEPELLDTFSDWIVEQGLATAEEVEEGLENEDSRSLVLRYLHAEIFNSLYGIEARYEVLARGDAHIDKALSLFGEASELLAKRLELEVEAADSKADAKTASLGR